MNVHMGTCLSGHTVFFSVSHHTTTPQHTTQTTHQIHDTRHNTTRRQTETEKEDRDRGRRGDEREDDKTRAERRVKREKIHFQCGGAWPFFIGVVIFRLIPFAHETLAS